MIDILKGKMKDLGEEPLTRLKMTFSTKKMAAKKKLSFLTSELRQRAKSDPMSSHMSGLNPCP
jgi:hypothetical protein